VEQLMNSDAKRKLPKATASAVEGNFHLGRRADMEAHLKPGFFFGVGLLFHRLERVVLCLALWIAFCLGNLSGTARVTAQTPQTPPVQPNAKPGTEETVPAAGGEEATLTLNNRKITVFRARFFGRSPQVRVEGAQRQFQEVIESRQVGTVTAHAIPQGMQILIGEEGIFTLTPADLEEVSEETMDEAATRAVNNLKVAYNEALELRDARRLTKGIGLAILAIILLLFTFWALRRLRKLALNRLPQAASARVRDVRIGGFTFLKAERLLELTRWLLNAGVWVVGLVAVYLWLAYSLQRFPYTRPWGEALGSYLLAIVKGLLLNAFSALPGLLAIAIIFALTRFLVRSVKTFFNAVEAGKVSVAGIYPDTAPATRAIVVTLLWLFALIVAYPYLPGSNSEAFKAVGVFLGLVISLSSSGLIGQAMSGLVLMYSRALKPGEYVHIKDVEGVVVSVSMFSTKICTVKREEITIPNSVILATTTRNYSRLTADAGSLAYTSVTIGYSVPWRQVHALLILAAERTPGLRKEPPPFVLQLALSDFYVEYQLNVALERPEERLPVLAKLHPNIQDVFNEYGVQIMSPHYVEDPPQRVWVPRERWYDAPSRQDGSEARAATDSSE
jgi:small-conductance mechanosensitive channel